MNNQKIAFIYCVNDYALYEESIEYIQSLNIPDGYEIEMIPIENAPSITSGYNKGMASSDAKYKVYLHQDVFIRNKNFIVDILSIFEKNPEFGMLGVAGAKTIPLSGVWWESSKKIGKVYENHTGNMDLLQFADVTQTVEEVSAIDGLIMITQYDLFWREDLFAGWHFYDLSQSMEFIKAGYQVGIPMQETPWCIHDCGVVNVSNGYEESKTIFIRNYQEEYAKDYPLVSVLIPTYNRPYYFELALQSVIKQTYPNIEILICDDSTNHDTEALIQKYLQTYHFITYIKNEKNLGQFENDLKLLNLAKGEYVNFLMDDDLFHPEKIEKMVNYFVEYPEVSLVTSHRQLIDSNGNFLGDIASTTKIFTQDTIASGIQMGEFILKNLINFIGEPTTVLFRVKSLKELFGTFNGRKNICNVDLATWMNLLSEGSLVYVSQTLSYFRIHSGQQLNQSDMLTAGTIDFANMILGSRAKGFLKSDRDYEIALMKWFDYTKVQLDGILQTKDQMLLSDLQDVKKSIELEYNHLIQPKLENAMSSIKNNYSQEDENIIIFMIPGENAINGGILSIFSLYEETKNIANIHHSQTIMCTRPNDTILLKNTNFQNDVPIYPFELTLGYFKNIKNCIIHIPESYVEFFMKNISEKDSLKLRGIPNLQINILNQNITMMPSKQSINKLRIYTDNITCTTAHKRYTTLYYRNLFGVPLHLFSTYGRPDLYNRKSYREKEQILIVSPDPHPIKDKIIGRVKEQLPHIKILEIRNMKYEEYKEWISRAKWAITFGEGFDGYFLETSFSGAISFAVYNTEFFPENFQGLKTVFESYQQMYDDLVKVINELDPEEAYNNYHQKQYGLICGVYNYEEYKENIKLFYRKNYTFK